MFLDSLKVRLIFYFVFCFLFYFCLSLSTKAETHSRYTMEPIRDNPVVSHANNSLSERERHCLTLTLLGEATPNHRIEVIAITRLILRRREALVAAHKYDACVCQVTLANKQFSVWNNRSMKTFRYNQERYEMYSKWVDEALAKGPIQHNHYWHPKTMKKLYKRYNPYWAKSCIVRETIGHAIFCTIGANSSVRNVYNKRLSKSSRWRHSRFQRAAHSIRKR